MVVDAVRILIVNCHELFLSGNRARNIEVMGETPVQDQKRVRLLLPEIGLPGWSLKRKHLAISNQACTLFQSDRIYANTLPQNLT